MVQNLLVVSRKRKRRLSAEKRREMLHCVFAAPLPYAGITRIRFRGFLACGEVSAVCGSPSGCASPGGDPLR